MTRRTDWRKDQGAHKKRATAPVCHRCFKPEVKGRPVKWNPRFRQRTHKRCPVQSRGGNV